MFGEAAAGSDGGAAGAGEIVAVGADDAFDDAKMENNGDPRGQQPSVFGVRDCAAAKFGPEEVRGRAACRLAALVSRSALLTGTA